MKLEGELSVCCHCPTGKTIASYGLPAVEVPGKPSWGKDLMHLHARGSCSPLGNQNVPETILYHAHILPNISPPSCAYCSLYPPVPKGWPAEHQSALPLLQFVLRSEGACPGAREASQVRIHMCLHSVAGHCCAARQPRALAA